jgi:RNA polymerase sigma factor (sigma-70 family)
MSTADTALLEQWRTRRDADAFAEIVARHSGVVYATCRRVLGNAADAEDVAQECFVELMGAHAKVRSSLPAWLHTMALHRSLDRLKKEKRRRDREKRYADGQAVQTEFELDDVLAHVDEAIAELPPQLREPIVHRFLEGQTHETIARTVGSAESTVRYRLGKGVEQVRAALRRRGVSVSATGLAGVMAVELAEAAPAALTVRLGKLAMAGLRTAAKPAGTAAASGIMAFIGQLGAVKIAALVAAVAALAGLGLWATQDEAPPAPAVTSTTLPGDTASAVPATDAAMSPEPAQDGGKAETALAKAPAPSAVNAQGAAEGEGGIITGRVYDAETGKGIEGVRFFACLPDGSVAKASDDPSDSSGGYRLSGLPPGPYTIMPMNSAPGYPDDPFRMSLTVTASAAKPIKGVDFALKQGIRVAGTVVSAGGRPVANAKVVARTEGMVNPEHTKTHEDGTFELHFALPSETLFMRASTRECGSPIETWLALPAEGLSGVVLTLTEPKASGVAGVVRDSAGAPVLGANVFVMTTDHMVLSDSGSVKTGKDGTFRIAELSAGTYAISVTEPGVTRHNRTDELARVKLGAGQTRNDLALVLGDKGGLAIAGRVVDTAGNPIATVRIECGGPAGEAVYTDEHGAFRITGLEEAGYNLWANHPDYTYAGAVAPAGANDVLIEMKGEAGIIGRVVRADTGEAIPEFEIAFSNGGAECIKQALFANARRVEDPEGRFLLENVCAAPVAVSARAPGFAPAFVNLSPAEDETLAGVELRLEPVGVLVGRVVDAAGKPVPDALIFLDGSSQDLGSIERRPLARTMPDGYFELSSLSPQYEVVGAYYPGFAPATAPISGETVVVLPEPGSVQGTVTVEGQAVPECHVTLRHSPGKKLPYAYATVRDSVYAMDGITPGGVTIEASIGSPIRTTLSRRATVESGRVTTLDLDFPSGPATVEGLITENGGPPPSAQAMLLMTTPVGVYQSTVPTGPDGTYRFEGLPQGSGISVTALLEVSATGKSHRYLKAQLDFGDGVMVRQDFDFPR